MTEEETNTNEELPPLILNNYLRNVRLYWEINPFFYTRTNIFWFWNTAKNTYEMWDDIDVMINLDKKLRLIGQTIEGHTKANYMEAFKRVGRSHIPEDAPKTWIQFNDKIYDCETKEEFIPNHKYFLTNPIPHNVGESTDTPVMDKLFTDWVGNDEKEMLYEIIAYCTLKDMPIHSLFSLVGGGRNGKSQFLKIINTFLGNSNVCTTELENLMSNRFESAKLYKKLCAIMGETNFKIMEKTSLLKKLVGGDLIGYEYKNKNPFDENNYAKIIIASNSLPSSLDTSEGFYRRWHIINFKKEFKEGKDIVQTIPAVEYDNLSRKCKEILPKILERGFIQGNGSIEERKKKYIMNSNPLSLFLDEYFVRDIKGYVRYGDLYSWYIMFLNNKKMRRVSHKEFNEALGEEGYYVHKTSKSVMIDNESAWQSDRWVEGLSVDESKDSDFRTAFLLVTRFYTAVLHKEPKLGVSYKSPNNHKTVQNVVPDYNLWESKEESVLDHPNFSQIEQMLEERKPQEMPLERAEELGFGLNDIQKWIFEGKLAETRKGVLTLVK